MLGSSFNPVELLKTITDIKTKIYELDVFEKYNMLGEKYSKSSVSINSKALDMIKELDKQIVNSEVSLIKTLNMSKN
jgi:hypothetical protein